MDGESGNWTGDARGPRPRVAVLEEEDVGEEAGANFICRSSFVGEFSSLASLPSVVTKKIRSDDTIDGMILRRQRYTTKNINL